jgi:hypothetical protein
MKYIRLLALVPFIGMLGFLPLANTVTPYVFGIPFIMFWVVLWVLLTSVCLVIIYKFDPVIRKEDVE